MSNRDYSNMLFCLFSNLSWLTHDELNVRLAFDRVVQHDGIEYNRADCKGAEAEESKPQRYNSSNNQYRPVHDEAADQQHNAYS